MILYSHRVAKPDGYQQSKVGGNLATELKILRIRKGLNQEEMGKQIGISQVTISSWERGDSIPSGKNIKKLAEFFGVKPNIIFDAVFNKNTL